MFAFPLTKFKMREIAEPSSEEVIRGPKEAFVENLQTNITMLRRKIKSEKLTVEKLHFGSISNTETAIVYIHGLCSENLLEEIKERLSRIELDAVLGTSYLEAYLEDNP